MADRVHTHNLRVYYEDTDAGGVVYHTNYLSFMLRARTEWLRGLGFDYIQLEREHRLVFAVKSCSIEYVAPARLDDWLEIESKITGMGAATLDFAQTIRHEGQVMVEGTVKLVTLDTSGKVLRMPSALREAIRSWREG